MNSSITKPWYASTTVWGALVSVAGSVLALLKVQLDPQLLADLREWVLALVSLVGGGIALWGRVRATRRIAGTARPSDPTSGSSSASAILLGPGLVLLLLSVSGCAALSAPQGPYVAADRATYDAIAPEYRAYVAADPQLDPEHRARRERSVELWRLRLEDAEVRAQQSGF